MPPDDWYDDCYADRVTAGRRLAERLSAYRGSRALVLALPPGGVLVAGELAHALRLPLDVLVAREFSAPHYPAIVAGALSEGGGLCLNRVALRLPKVTPDEMWIEARRMRAELAELVVRYRGDRPLPALGRRLVILVDDGLGDGLPQLAALQSLRQAHVRRCVVATPRATKAAQQCVARQCDDLIALEVIEDGDAGAGAWRRLVGDDETPALLERCRGRAIAR
jgi:putative phosphoribosyl transferase